MRTVVRQILTLCGLALVPALAAMALHPKHPGWDPNRLAEGEILLSKAEALGRTVLWVDARPEKEYQTEHIPGAVPLNEDRWDSLLSSFLERWMPGQTVVVYCDSRLCDASRSVAKRLRESGAAPVYVLKGGWEAWRRARGERPR